MMRLRQRRFWRIPIFVWLAFCITATGLLSALLFFNQPVPRGGQAPAQKIVAGARVVQQQTSAPTPFLHRPYYGNQTISQRTVSFVDHDHPWYDNDGTFVRYDGATWTHVGIGTCTGGVNCYDGHNGYDLNLWYEPVLSAAAGTVIRANWYNPLNHNSSLGLWVAIDHGNGYATAYGHLSAITVSVGDQVGTQWQIGTSGTTGSSTGPHLHMATYYLPYWQATDPFGWTGKTADPNIVPDNYLWVSNPASSQTVPILSSNGSAVYPGATLIDDGGAGWSSTGAWSSDSASNDVKGGLHWTATSSGNATATATWQPTLSADGYYEVGVYVDATHASSSWVPYTVYSADPNHAGGQLSHTVYLDESHIGVFQGPFSWENTGPQWVGIGTYYFKAGTSARVVVSNATGESGAQIAADGVEFVPVLLQATSPTPAPSYLFQVTGETTPAIMLPGSSNAVRVTLKNTGNFSWSASGSNAVQLVYRWLNAQGRVLSTSSPIALPQTVDASNSVTVPLTVQAPTQTGSYTLQWDMVQGATIFSQHGAQAHNDGIQIAPRYSEDFSGNSLPMTLTPGATVQMNVRVQNKGAVPWSANSASKVMLTYQWQDSSGHALNPVLTLTGNPANLPADVAPGGMTTIPILVHTPALAGNYRLIYDLQQQNGQGVMSFASQGASPLTLNMTITPNLPTTYYFAEGYTGKGTTEQLALVNPSVTQATITITYLYQSRSAQTRVYQVAGQAQRVLNINQEAGNNQTVSMIVQGDHPFAAERTIFTQDAGLVATSDSVGTSSTSTSWYFADGNTNYGWNTLLAVLNPNNQPVTLHITYLLTQRVSSGYREGRVSSTVVPARSRSTIVLNSLIPNAQFGMAIQVSSAVVIERPEYLIISPRRGGSSVVGATSAQKSWYFGAGSTTAGFVERLVLANPNVGSANTQISYYTSNGSVIRRTLSLPAMSRVEVDVNAAVGQALHATVVSANLPIVAERADFFSATMNGAAVVGSTGVMGSAALYASWYIAQSNTANGRIAALMLANPNNSSAQVQVVYYKANGTPLVKNYSIAANARMTVNVVGDVGSNQVVGIAVYASNPIVVEQATYVTTSGISGGDVNMGYGR